MTHARTHTVLCNWAEEERVQQAEVLRLGYDGGPGEKVALGLPPFIERLGTLPDRIRDLVELASYVYCADRHLSRGRADSVEYHAWARSLKFKMRVRDGAFWARPEVRETLQSLLSFLSGDEEYTFEFIAGHPSPAVTLFDDKQPCSTPAHTEVLLFSGGLDSLAGAVKHLTEEKSPLCLVSHRSGNPGTARTQDQLTRALDERFPGRTSHYKFKCHLQGERAPEETQRTRFFLYGSIAFALSHTLGKRCFIACENGITSINFPRRQDGMQGRTSRTTHPRTIAGLSKFFSLVADHSFSIETPFLWSTKADVVGTLRDCGHINLLASSVSCTKTYKGGGPDKTHCGTCFQCVDRRIAVWSASAEDSDSPSLYATDFGDSALDAEAKTVFLDYVSQALTISQLGDSAFYTEHVNELADLTQHVGEVDEAAAVGRLWQLWRKHGNSVLNGLKRFQAGYEDLSRPVPKGSALELLHLREYLKKPVARLVETLSDRLRESIPLAFQRRQPDSENELNDHIEAILRSEDTALVREHPCLRFGIARAIPDHDIAGSDLVIESKYIRKGRRPSAMTNEIAAAITKYKRAGHILFVVYDPNSQIHDRKSFSSVEDDNDCTVLIVP